VVALPQHEAGGPRTEVAPHLLQNVVALAEETNEPETEPLGVPTLLGTAKLRLCRKLVGGLYICFAICEVLMLGSVLRRLGGGCMVGVWRRSRYGESCGLDELGGERDGTRKVGGLGHLGTVGGLLVDCWLWILLVVTQLLEAQVDGVVMGDISIALAAPIRPCPRIMPATAAAMACTLSGEGAAAAATILCCGPGLA